MFSLFKKNVPPKLIHETEYAEIEREDFLNNFFLPKKPLLIKNGLKDWPLYKRWNKEYIINLAGNEQCTLVYDSRPAASKKTTTLKDYFLKQKECSTLSLKEFNKKNKPKFFNDLQIPNKLFGYPDIYRYFFFHAPNNTGTLPHNHGDAFNFLVRGKKEWVMFDADKENETKGFELLLNFNKKYPVGAHSLKWFENELPTLGKKIPTHYSFIQEAGDIVFIPHRYAHTVLNLEEAMGIVIETKRHGN